MLISSVLAAVAPSPAESQPPAAPPQQGFASLLRQSQAAKPAQPPPRQAPLPPKPQAAEPAKTPEPAKAPPPQARANTRPDEADAAARAARRDDGARSVEAEAPASRETDGEQTEARSAKPAKTADDAAPPDDALAQWLLGLQPQAGASGLAWPGGRAAGAADGASAAADASDTADAADAAQTVEATGRQRLRALSDDAARRGDPSQPKTADLSANGPDAKLANQPAAADLATAFVQLEKPERLFKPVAPEAVPGAAIVGALTPSGGSAATAAPAAVHLATPPDAPDFARALGAQLSVLAKDGVQRAELHLNPAEMGPVSVHIVMAGSHARIEFGADLAATRQILEAGLPELAGALREAGLTLTGGGVSQHSSPRDEGQAAEGGSSGSGDGLAAVDATAPRPLRRTVSAGGVDLYA